MTNLKTLGNLAVLPRKVRYHIYAEVFAGEEFLVYHSNAIVKSSLGIGSDKIPQTRDVGISIVSKAIHAESAEMLYMKSTFHFVVSGNESVLENPRHEVFDRMMNITIERRFSSEFEAAHWNTNKTTSRKPDLWRHELLGPIGLFTNSNISRNSIKVTLTLDHFSSYFHNTINSPMFDAIKEYGGFKTVQLGLQVGAGGCPPPSTTAGTLDHWKKTKQWDMMYAEVDSFFLKANETLEPYLKSSGTMSALEVTEYPDISAKRHITFHPRAHLLNVSKAASHIKAIEQHVTEMDT